MDPKERTKSVPENSWERTIKEQTERNLALNDYGDPDFWDVYSSCSTAIEYLADVVHELIVRIEDLEKQIEGP